MCLPIFGFRTVYGLATDGILTGYRTGYAVVSGINFVMFVMREYPAAPKPLDQAPRDTSGSPVARPRYALVRLLSHVFMISHHKLNATQNISSLGQVQSIQKSRLVLLKNA
jgi:hypothetical protein